MTLLQQEALRPQAMKIVVHDTASAMLDLLRRPWEERPDALRELLSPLYAAAHELHHNVRHTNAVWNPLTVTVGEQVMAEGLAEAFVRELAGERAMGPWATARRPVRNWTTSTGSSWPGSMRPGCRNCPRMCTAPPPHGTWGSSP